MSVSTCPSFYSPTLPSNPWGSGAPFLCHTGSNRKRFTCFSFRHTLPTLLILLDVVYIYIYTCIFLQDGCCVSSPFLLRARGFRVLLGAPGTAHQMALQACPLRPPRVKSYILLLTSLLHFFWVSSSVYILLVCHMWHTEVVKEEIESMCADMLSPLG